MEEIVTHVGGAPRPQKEAGVGQWISSFGSNPYVLPTGGTWVYALTSLDFIAGVGSNTYAHSGFAAGGTKIQGYNQGFSGGFAWRIA